MFMRHVSLVLFVQIAPRRLYKRRWIRQQKSKEKKNEKKQHTNVLTKTITTNKTQFSYKTKFRIDFSPLSVNKIHPHSKHYHAKENGGIKIRISV